jgi:hypothetical protein
MGVAQLPVLLLAGVIAFVSGLVLTERLARPDVEIPRWVPSDTRLLDPYTVLPAVPVALSPGMGMPPMRPFRDMMRGDTLGDTFPSNTGPVERVRRLAALLGERRTAWLVVDEPARLIGRAVEMGVMPRGPIMPAEEHLAMIEERFSGPALVSFDNRAGGWTLVLGVKEPYETLQKLAEDTDVELSGLLNEEGESARRILQLNINAEMAETLGFPLRGTLWIITHEGIDVLFISNNSFEARRYMAGLARGLHTVDPEDLINRDAVAWPLALDAEWQSDDRIDIRFELLAVAATANTTANSEALRTGEWLLGLGSWERLQTTLSLEPDGTIDWELRALLTDAERSKSAMVNLLGAEDARDLMTHLPADARMAVAFDLASPTETYDAWRDHLVTMGFPGGAEGLARAERDLAMSLGFWIRESLLPLVGNRAAIATYGTGEDQTWMAVIEMRDIRSVERMIAQASRLLDGEDNMQVIDGVTFVPGKDDARARAWKSVGNRLVVGCGNLAASLVGSPATVTVADTFTSVGNAAGANVQCSPLSVYAADLVALPLPLSMPLIGVFSTEDGALVLRGSAIPAGLLGMNRTTTSAVR